MYELIQVGENTYYIEGPTKVGIYHLGDGDVCLIDSGNGKDMGRRILKILNEKGWTLQRILCTHAHADHIGGNHILQERTGCPIYGPGISWFMVEHTEFSPALLYGGYPATVMKKKSVMAQTSMAEEMTEENLPPGLSMLRLDGHSPSMAGIRTDDDVWFLADSLVGKKPLRNTMFPSCPMWKNIFPA